MTSNQRKKHLIALEIILLDAGFEQDSYGNFKYPKVNCYRFKFKKVNMRIEHKMGSLWKAIESKTWSQLTLPYFTKCVESMKKRCIRELPEKVTKTSKGVPFAPALSNPAKVKQIETIVDKRNYQDYQCFMILQEMQDAGLLFSSKNVPADMMDAADLGERARTAVKNRIDLNDKFMRLMAGVE